MHALKMNLKLFLALCFLGSVLAYPYEYDTRDVRFDDSQDDSYAFSETLNPLESQRLKRQLNVQGGGGPGQGIDLSIDTRVPVWKSDNGRHSFDATGQYAQHLGGPWGNSRPIWGVGGVYTFRF